MKLFSSFVLAAVSADESRGACNSLIREELKKYPIIGGSWDCSRTGKDQMNCEVKCDGAGRIYEFKGSREVTKRKNPKIPYIRASDCSVDDPASRLRTKWLKDINEENPIECVDFTLGDCDKKAQDVLAQQKDIGNSGGWSCGMNRLKKEYVCEIGCANKRYLTPHRYFAGFSFTQCHTEEPELAFYGMEDGDKFECLTCDEKIDRMSSQIENGSFVKLDRRNRRELNYNGGGGNGGRGVLFSTFYEINCDDGSVTGKYKCQNKGGYISHVKGSLVEDQPCSVKKN